ncbi:MAG: hypothetical protein EPN82_14445 [Bacteroidetes bacterium]|nr:MAG: hypothetical protein EPN82_14445 [Bacteroidota bacterium]
MKLTFSLLMLGLLFIVISCKDSPVAVDNVIRIGFISISDSAKLKVDEDITITAYVSKPKEIERVDLFVNNLLIESKNQEPYEFKWSSKTTGVFYFRLVAVKGEQQYKSELIKAFVTHDFLPVISLAPYGNYNRYINDTLHFVPDVYSPNGSIVKIDFYENNELYLSDSLPPFEFDWLPLKIGDYSLKAIAWDDKGHKGESGEILSKVTDFGESNIHFDIYNPPPTYTKSTKKYFRTTVTASNNNSNHPLNKIEVYYDYELYTTLYKSSEEFTIYNLQAGVHTLYAKAYYKQNDIHYSDTVKITVLDGFDFEGNIIDVKMTDSFLYLIDDNNSELIIADRNNTDNIQHYKLPFINPNSIAISPGLQKVFIGYSNINKFSIFDISTKTFRNNAISKPVYDLDIDIQDNLLYLLSGNNLLVYDINNDKIVYSIAGVTGRNLIFDNIHQDFYILESSTPPNKLHKFSAKISGQPVLEQTNSDVGQITGKIKDLINFNSDNSMIYFQSYNNTDYENVKITEILTSNIENINKQITLKNTIQSSVLTSDSKYLYVIFEDEMIVEKYDLTNKSLIAEYRVPWKHERVKLLLDEKSNQIIVTGSDGSYSDMTSYVIFIDL